MRVLQVVIPSVELFDDRRNEFVSRKEQVLLLEHSLVSVSKWESKWNKPFLDKKEKTQEEIIDYIKCMTVTQNVEPEVYERIPMNVQKEISDYISAPMTATTIKEDKKGSAREIVTSELIYYWMISLQIPFECQKWHLNRLLTLIQVCNRKNTPPKKMGKNELMRRNSELNAQRRAALHSKG